MDYEDSPITHSRTFYTDSIGRSLQKLHESDSEKQDLEEKAFKIVQLALFNDYNNSKIMSIIEG